MFCQFERAILTVERSLRPRPLFAYSRQIVTLSLVGKWSVKSIWTALQKVNHSRKETWNSWEIFLFLFIKWDNKLRNIIMRKSRPEVELNLNNNIITTKNMLKYNLKAQKPHKAYFKIKIKTLQLLIMCNILLEKNVALRRKRKVFAWNISDIL